MKSFSVEKAKEFLDEHFKIFLDKKREAGYHCEIILRETDNTNDENYFYVQFCKKNECTKCYKVMC